MDNLDSEWQRKGATLSDKTAQEEFGLTRDEVIRAIRAGKLQYREGSMHGNPWLRLLRREVEALVKKIPQGRVMTTPSLRKALAERHNAQVTCPFLTKRALMAIAEDPETTVPFWRVVMAKGEMIAAYPGGGTKQARRLKNEGVMIAGRLGTYKVMNVRETQPRS